MTTLSEASLPVFEIGLNALSALLDKAAEYAAAKKIDPAVLLNARLSVDMYPLVRQVQIVTDQATKATSMTAKTFPPVPESLPPLRKRSSP